MVRRSELKRGAGALGPTSGPPFVAFFLGLLVFGASAAHVYSRVINRQYSLKATGAYRVDVNRATLADLELLPGIHRELASRILEERRRGGSFAGGDDLAERVRGVGPKTVEALAEVTFFSGDLESR